MKRQNKHSMYWGGLAAALVLALVLTLLVAACGGDEEEAEQPAPTATEAAAPTEGPLGEYPANGPEADVAGEYPEPEIMEDFRFTVGFSQPLGANEELGAREDGIIAEAKRLGGKAVVLDNQLNVDKQVSDMNQLIAQKVDAIITYPLDPKALGPVLRRAEQAGIPVFAMDATFEPGEPAPGYVTQTWQGRDHEAFLMVNEMARIKPGAKIVIIGIGAPVPSLKYWVERVKYWAGQAGLEVLGVGDNPTDDAAGGEQAMNGLLGRFAEVDAVIAYNDPSALGAVAAARSAGREIIAIGENGGQDGLQGVSNGRVAATLQHDAVGIGVQLVRAAYNYLTEQNMPLPDIVLRKPIPVTKENVDQVVPWDEQVKEIGE